MTHNQLKIQTIYYSPTGTTKKNLDAIVKGFGGIPASEINLTKSTQRDQKEHQINGDIIFIAVPVYSGTIPYIIQDSIQRLKGNGQWAVIIATYGHVKKGTCLQNLFHILTTNNFKVLGAAAVLGEHSFCCDRLPLGNNRPNAKDLTEAEEFGQKLRKKLDSNPTPIELPFAELPPPKPRLTFVLLPKINEKCTKCLKCADACPTDAIIREDLSIIDNLCILCCACVKACEFSARNIEFNATAEKFEQFYMNTKLKFDAEFIM